MKKLVDGQYIEMTPTEIAALQKQAAIAAVQERRRDLTESEVLALLIPGIINTAQVDDNTALRMRTYYPEWQSGDDYPAGHKVQHDGKLWRCIQGHSSITGWEPEHTASLWEQVCESHTGELTDPIPYEGNMALTAGLHYIQDGMIYRCIRDTGNPVYNRLEELVGLYVEEVS